MLEIMTIVGARPQFIKAAVFSRRVHKAPYSGKIHETLVHTGQHYDSNMSDIFFRDMEIPEPEYNLGIGSGTHGATTGAMLAGIEKLIIERKPDVVLVYGDTNSTLAGALAASKLHIPVAHVEAGLRSFMMVMPEEQNRVLTDHLSTWLFCPTTAAVENLKHEGIGITKPEKPTADTKDVVQCGDIMYEGSFFYRKKALEITKDFMAGMPKKFYLLTMHRAENTDDRERMASIVRAINRFNDVEAVFPVHPRTRKILVQYGLQFEPHVHLIDPVGYFEMLALENACEFVMTDSGGVQKEAYFFGKPCITLRDSTEWVELVMHGWNRLVGTDDKKIDVALAEMPILGDKNLLYGKGNTSKAIADVLLENF
jgi:UDP-GlcNAc3NAcA epimerase